MARFFTLASGSSGNSTFIGNSDYGILIDCGLSCKKICKHLLENEVDISKIRGIFITHEHIDHIKGLRVLISKYKIPVYARTKTLEYLCDMGEVSKDAKLISVDNEQTVGDMKIESFKTTHDCVDSCGFVVTTSDLRKVAFATDLGEVSPEIKQKITGADLVVIESNYDERMLLCGDYTYALKQRVQKTHLSNDECSALLPELVSTGSTRFVLAHLSDNNNMPDIAFKSAECELSKNGFSSGEDYILSVAPRFDVSNLMRF
ncbi:MAG: MBL fold metallo-hydrolase [Oscillospiraceae bacterium]|nr:MBL fold metallo-hydrolase [Oscillospiraceae bacterium]